ncbi:MAG: peptidylprolyl isomerase [Pirellulaceae bacterium]|nr:peptidylprolyl isomerase [Pirellulaceae bacterium]
MIVLSRIGALVALVFAQAGSLGYGMAFGAADERTVAATVDGQSIYADQVDRELTRALGERTVDAETRDKLRRETLRQMIDRRLVLQYLTASGAGANQAEVDRAVQRLQKLAADQGIAWPEFLERRGTDEPQLREELTWQIGWSRFLEQHATDENLQRFFQQHRREFDGTQIRAAHILLRVEPADDAKQIRQTIARAEQLRQRIAGGELDFAEAAKQFSQAPTAADGGEIGLIGRRGPMPEPFSAAAFALEAGQVSPPVVSVFGVHLIQCQQIVPGDKTWQQVRGDLHQAVSRYLFRWAADRQRPHARIEF